MVINISGSCLLFKLGKCNSFQVLTSSRNFECPKIQIDLYIPGIYKFYTYNLGFLDYDFYSSARSKDFHKKSNHNLTTIIACILDQQS